MTQIPSNFRRGGNGHIFVPHRGKPPPCPDGYEPIPGNSYTFRIKIPECEYRSIKLPTSNCCGQSPIPICEVIQKPVRRPTCAECGACPAWIKEHM